VGGVGVVKVLRKIISTLFLEEVGGVREMMMN